MISVLSFSFLFSFHYPPCQHFSTISFFFSHPAAPQVIKLKPLLSSSRPWVYIFPSGIKDRQNKVNEFLMRNNKAGGDTGKIKKLPSSWLMIIRTHSNKANRVIYFSLRETPSRWRTGNTSDRFWKTKCFTAVIS